MESGKRIILNSFVQYVRSAICMLLQLFSTRFVLSALGEDGFGVFSVVGSVVVMLNFLTTSLAGSTQRFLNYSHGVGDKRELRTIFANAMWLHLGIALFMVALLGALEPLAMNFLTVPADRASATVYVYFMVLFMVMMTFVTAPVRALFIARENIVFVSCVEVTDAVLKLGGALLIPYLGGESLIIYSAMLASLAVLNFLIYVTYAGVKYEECHVPRFVEFSRSHLKRLTGFAVWNTYAVGSTVLRTQGMAMVINRFLFTMGNAAYGVAQQVSNAVSFIAMSILNAVNPQLMKAEGAGDRQRMLMLSTKESKYSFLVLSILLIPMVVEMPAILQFWLKDVPEHAVMFCQFILIDTIWDQSTIGLTSANQAVGKIRNYSLLTSTIRLTVLPIAWFCLQAGLPPVSVMVGYVAVDVLIGFIRIPFLKVTAGLNAWNYVKDVYVRCALPILVVVAVSWAVNHSAASSYRFVLTEIVTGAVGVVMVYLVALDSSERTWIVSKFNRKRRKP